MTQSNPAADVLERAKSALAGVERTRCRLGLNTSAIVQLFTPELVGDLIEALTAAQAEVAWRDIESAPRDGTMMDLWVAELEERYPDGYFSQEHDAFAWVCTETGRHIVFTATPPTHYIIVKPPLSTKPATAAGEK